MCLIFALYSSSQRSFSWSTGKGDRCDWTMSGTWQALEKRKRWVKAHLLFCFCPVFVKNVIAFSQKCEYLSSLIQQPHFRRRFCHPKGFLISTDELGATVFLCGGILDLYFIQTVVEHHWGHQGTQKLLVFIVFLSFFLSWMSETQVCLVSENSHLNEVTRTK